MDLQYTRAEFHNNFTLLLIHVLIHASPSSLEINCRLLDDRSPNFFLSEYQGWRPSFMVRNCWTMLRKFSMGIYGEHLVFFCTANNYIDDYISRYRSQYIDIRKDIILMIFLRRLLQNLTKILKKWCYNIFA